MKSPQKENGYVAIANELYEALARFRIPGEADQLLKVIFRKTYGFNKKRDAISLSQFHDATGIYRSHIPRSLAILKEMNIVASTNNGTSTTIFEINKDYDTWKVVPKKGTAKKLVPIKVKTSTNNGYKLVPIMGTKVVPIMGNTKDNNHLKDNIQKTGGNAPSKNARYFFKGVRDLMENPKSETEEAIATRLFLQALEAKHPQAGKGAIWREIKKFESYWTELNQSGTKQRWQLERVFQVDRRLGTWFGKVKEFQEVEKNINTKPKRNIVR